VLCGGLFFPFVLVYFTWRLSVLAKWQSTQRLPFPQQTKYEDVDSWSIRVPLKRNICSSQTYYVLPPFAVTVNFWVMATLSNTADGQLGFTLHTITGFHRPNFTHYYGFICHLTPLNTLSLPLNVNHLLYVSLGARLPQLLH
jgi:hypothetical protein